MSGLLSVYANCSLGGVASVMRERVRLCRDLGIGSDFYFLNDFGGAHPLIEAGARDVRIGWISHERNIRSMASREDVGLVNLFSNFGLAPGLKARTGRRIQVEVHGSHESALEDLERAKGAYDRIVVPSDWSRRWLSTNGVDPDRIAVVPNCVNRTAFHAEGAGPERAPADGLRPLVWVGRIEEHKNWRDALLVFALLRRRGLPVRLRMVMSLYNDQKRVADLMSQAALYGISDAIEVLYNLPQAEVGDILRQAAAEGGCSFMTTRLESFGLTASESIACGLPVVAPEVGALPERVIHGKTGYLFDYRDSEGAADLIERTIFDGEARSRIAQALIRRARETDAEAEAAFRTILDESGLHSRLPA